MTDGSLSLTDAAYIAGLIDGEGHIAITKIASGFNRRVNPSYQLLVRVAMTHHDTIQWYADVTGAELRFRAARGLYHANAYEANRADHNALRLLKQIMPFLITKRAQAELAVAFRETFSNSRSRKTPKEVVELRESFFLKMKALNERGSR